MAASKRRIEVSDALIHPKTPTIPHETTLARRLATRLDAQHTAVRQASPVELLYYNAWLDYEGKEAADQWLTNLWHQ